MPRRSTRRRRLAPRSIAADSLRGSHLTTQCAVPQTPPPAPTAPQLLLLPRFIPRGARYILYESTYSYRADMACSTGYALHSFMIEGTERIPANHRMIA